MRMIAMITKRIVALLTMSLAVICHGREAAADWAWKSTDPVPDSVINSTRLLRERLLADPYRPAYHFCVPEDMGEPGDPNGAFYYQGRYHLMYLYERRGVGFCWGHVSSADLLHWRHHPDALAPGQGDEGVFSGGAFVDDDGSAYLSYWMLPRRTRKELGEFKGDIGGGGIGLAKGSGRYFEHWAKLESDNPVIKSDDWGITKAKDASGNTIFYGSADPSNIWKKDGQYYMVTGNLLVLNKIGRGTNAPSSEQGDRVYLFSSPDLKKWEYRHVFYERRPDWTDRSEDNMCTSFLPLATAAAGGAPSGKYLMLFISHNRGCQYFIGDYRNDRFYPETHGRMSWVDNTFFAPEALVDGMGRQIMWAWLHDDHPEGKKNGWAGVFSLPRNLWLGEDNTLRMQPVKELEKLRCHERVWVDLILTNTETRKLEGVVGDACELSMEIDPGKAARCGLVVRASPGGEEETLVYYDATSKELVFDSTRSGVAGRKVVERAPFALLPGERLKLRVFVDKPVIEVFANDRQAIARRVYPVRSDSLEVKLFASGGDARFVSVKAWEMPPANPD